jgi:hypothetical protein
MISTREQQYENAAPLVNKMLNPDGSVTTLDGLKVVTPSAMTGVARTVFYRDENSPDALVFNSANPYGLDLIQQIDKRYRTGLYLRDGAMYEIVISMLDGTTGALTQGIGSNIVVPGLLYTLPTGAITWATLPQYSAANNPFYSTNNAGALNQFYTFRYQSHTSTAPADTNVQVMNIIAPMGTMDFGISGTSQKIGNSILATTANTHVDGSTMAFSRQEIGLNLGLTRTRAGLGRPELVLMNYNTSASAMPAVSCDCKLFVKVTERYSDNPQDA